MPLCYQGLASTAYTKSSTITMGHNVELYTQHALHALITGTNFVLTNGWRIGHDVILSAPELTIHRCESIDPAERMVTPVDGLTHDCEVSVNNFLKPRDDLQSELYSIIELNYFLDSSCCRGVNGQFSRICCSKVQYTVIHKLMILRILQSLSQPCAAQLTELEALTAACKICSRFTDSFYAFEVCHMYGVNWE